MADERNQIKLIHLYLHNLESLLLQRSRTHTQGCGCLKLPGLQKKKTNHSVQTELLFTDVQSQVFFFFFHFLFFFNSSLVCRRLLHLQKRSNDILSAGYKAETKNPGLLRASGAGAVGLCSCLKRPPRRGCVKKERFHLARLH